jgi:sigma-B regulation protein RsbU (phosphoserine phosphatase)
MSEKIDELFEDQKQKVLLESEVNIASTVQRTLIPPDRLDLAGFHIKSVYRSASSCGGDWWGAFRVGHRVVIGIADATGHGLPSALITASAHSCFSALKKIAEEDPKFHFSPALMLGYLNRSIFDSSKGAINMTFFLATIDLSSGIIRYLSAGHNPPWLFKKEQDRYRLVSLTASGRRLGETPDLDPVEEIQQSFGPEDILFLYTDGLTEGADSSGDQYGKKRVRKQIEANLATGFQAIIDALMVDFDSFRGETPLADDVTAVVATLGAAAANATAAEGLMTLQPLLEPHGTS